MANKAKDAVSVTRVVIFSPAFTRIPLGVTGLSECPVDLEGADVWIADANKAGWDSQAKQSVAGGANLLEIQTGCKLLKANFRGGLAGLDIQVVSDDGRCLGHLADIDPVAFAEMAIAFVSSKYAGTEFEVTYVYIPGLGLGDSKRNDDRKVAVQQTAQEALRLSEIFTGESNE